MANKSTYIVQTGVNGYQVPAIAFNKVATDILLPGIVGSYFNTSGVAPATGSFAVNAQGSPNMTVAVSAGTAYVSATPTGGTAQTVAVAMDASENVTIDANSTGSTRYDFVYLKVDADKMNNPASNGLDVATLTTQRSTTQDADSNGALANALLLAVVTVSNGASSIANSNITDRRLPVNSETDGWKQANETWTYASATTITVPTGATFKYSVGDKVKLMQSGAWKYFYIVGVAATTLTITGGSDYTLANATIAAPCYSKRATPVGFPSLFSWTPTWTNLTIGNATVDAKFSLSGKVLFFRLKLTWGNSTSSTGTGNRFSLPVNMASAYNDNDMIGIGTSLDVGSAAYITWARWGTSSTLDALIGSAGGTFVGQNNVTSTAPFTWATGDILQTTGSYEIA